MDCDIYKCTTCGAEITVNNVEAATFCAHCGQPTIVFSRVSTTVKPEIIIPFTVTKQEAESLIRNKIRSSFFVSKKIKNFEVDRICGIYIPFWVYNANYSSKQVYQGTVGSGDKKRTLYYKRECECSFANITLDASNKLNDISSGRLEPYDFNDVKRFNISYLSGFYADRYDISSKTLNSNAKNKIRELFNEKAKSSVFAKDVSLISDAPEYNVTSTIYAMLPAWFLTFTDDKNNCYTVMVNGQTKKVVGAVPYSKSKIIGTTLILGTILAFPCIKLVDMILTNSGKHLFTSILLILAGIIASFIMGGSLYDKFKESIRLTTSKTINKFIKERQDI